MQQAIALANKTLAVWVLYLTTTLTRLTISICKRQGE